mgnify:CR=1 FL=1
MYKMAITGYCYYYQQLVSGISRGTHDNQILLLLCRTVRRLLRHHLSRCPRCLALLQALYRVPPPPLATPPRLHPVYRQQPHKRPRLESTAQQWPKLLPQRRLRLSPLVPLGWPNLRPRPAPLVPLPCSCVTNLLLGPVDLLSPSLETPKSIAVNPCHHTLYAPRALQPIRQHVNVLTAALLSDSRLLRSLIPHLPASLTNLKYISSFKFLNFCDINL